MKRSVHLEGSQEGQPEGVQAHTDGGEAQDKQMLISRAAGPAQFLHGSVPLAGAAAGKGQTHKQRWLLLPLLPPAKMGAGSQGWNG